MQIKLPFDVAKPISAGASTEINRPPQIVFHFIAENFFVNYPKWATDVICLEPLDGEKVCIGAKGRQVRDDNGLKVESVFEIVEFQPCIKFTFHGLTAPYKQSYLIEPEPDSDMIKLTFVFDLENVELFMRPFEKLIRVAIEDGAESTIENIKNLLTTDCNGDAG
jgi:hypothetical protein